MDIISGTIWLDCYYFDKNERTANRFEIKVIGGKHSVRALQFSFQSGRQVVDEVQKGVELGSFDTIDQAITKILHELWFMERENDMYHPDKEDLLSEPFERTISMIKDSVQKQGNLAIFGCSKKYRYRRIEDRPDVEFPLFFDDIIPEKLKRHLMKKPRNYKTVKLKFLIRKFQSK